MALESERSEDHAHLRGLATLKGAAGEAVGHVRAVLAATTSGSAKAARSARDAAARLSAKASERLKATPGFTAGLTTVRAGASTAFAHFVRWFKRQPLVRFISASLLRRILASNLIGFLILVLGILYLGWVNTWLIDAKVDALKTQGEIIADAIAANATVTHGQIVVDPDKLADTPNASRQFPDDGLAALELSIHPEEVTPILRKLIKPTDTRARIYTRDGILIVDTARTLANLMARLSEAATSGPEPPKPQNFWTRLTRYLFKEPLPVYQEIDAVNGTAYPEVRDALRGNERSMLLLNKSGEQIVSMAVPIRRFKNVQGVLLLSTRPGQIDKILREERRVILSLAARTVAGPMKRLSAAAEQASRDIGARQRLPALAGRSDEVGQMAGAFQAMTEALYKRIEASERFAADVAHELKNPLTAARSTAESLSFAKTDEQRDHLVEQIKDELKRLNRLIMDVSNASRLDAELARKEMRSFDVPTMLRNVVGIFHDILDGDSRKVALVVDREPFEGAFTIVGDEGRLGQVLTNLVDNAVSFSPDGSTVTVRAHAERRQVEIIVEDEGPGIPEDRLSIIFDRFYSDRPETDASRGKNSGLGLSISREIVRAHGGEIVAENRYEEGAAPGTKPIGARFIVRLPAHRTQRGGAPVGRRG
jgi:two-component system sensor histidine kinase ChvG